MAASDEVPAEGLGAVYARFLASRTESPASLHLAGTLAHRAGRLDEAMDAYGRALALKPDFVAAHVDRGNALRELGRLEEAAAGYRRALALDPASVPAHANLAHV
ncbi:MAG: tetratricopeptide repeat protein, partial [Alphaproteobacteria bacterium]|nr:tetratricopeptide repeat protein [Alphaproteobacteria bacterium]